jgi:hypothetical protein
MENEAKAAWQVVQDVGLCICLYDLCTASEGLIGYGSGMVNVNGEGLPRRALNTPLANNGQWNFVSLCSGLSTARSFMQGYEAQLPMESTVRIPQASWGGTKS